MESTTLLDNERVREIVERLLKEHLPKARIESVDVHDYLNDAADRVIAIDIVFRGKRSDFATSVLRSLPRHIIAEFTKRNEPGFPLLSFIAKSEMEKSKADAR